MKIQNSEYLSLVQSFKSPKKDALNNASESYSFEQVLNQKQNNIQNVIFSKHAQNRLSERGIEMSESQVQRLENGTKLAQNKGIKESLVVVDQLAFIVNVPNKTVVTAIDQNDNQSNIFTNIDGAVFA